MLILMENRVSKLVGSGGVCDEATGSGDCGCMLICKIVRWAAQSCYCATLNSQLSLFLYEYSWRIWSIIDVPQAFHG
jgi:hypothetical protein